MQKLVTPRTLKLINKGIESYTFEAGYKRFEIIKSCGEWEMRVELTWGDEPTYGGMFYFDTLKNAKAFAANYYRASMA